MKSLKLQFICLALFTFIASSCNTEPTYENESIDAIVAIEFDSLIYSASQSTSCTDRYGYAEPCDLSIKFQYPVSGSALYGFYLSEKYNEENSNIQQMHFDLNKLTVNNGSTSSYYSSIHVKSADFQMSLEHNESNSSYTDTEKIIEYNFKNANQDQKTQQSLTITSGSYSFKIYFTFLFEEF
jgi:hypothetical protein